MLFSTPADYARIPEQMQRMKQWVVFQCAPQPDGHIDKKPRCPNGEFKTGCDGTKEWDGVALVLKKKWFSFQECKDAVEYCVGTHIGFCLTGASMIFVDIDDCVGIPAKKGLVDRWMELMKPSDPYVEMSVSGRGIHIFCYYTGRPLQCNPEPGVEVYTTDRFAVITGRGYYE